VIDALDLAGGDLIGEHHRKGSEAGAPTSRNPPVRFSFPPRPLPTAEPPPPVRRQNAAYRALRSDLEIKPVRYASRAEPSRKSKRMMSLTDDWAMT
jgi:hypothetical protein